MEAPENKPFQKESNLPTIIFQGRAAKLRECIFTYILLMFMLNVGKYIPYIDPMGHNP